jgi:hypothetical protein
MTRPEITGTRSLVFSQWVREKLPDSQTGFCVSDLDFILWNWKTKQVMLLEIKTYNTEIKTFQRMMWKCLDNWIAKGIDENWIYHGFHLIKFEASDFNDGKCFLDNKEIKEDDLIRFLSFEQIYEANTMV